MKRCANCQSPCWEVHRHCPTCGADLAHASSLDGDALEGVTVGGKFILRELIAEGAMGKVYRADQTNLGRTVAVKVMNPVLAADEGLVRRFHDEARSASRLNHPHIVSIIDFGQTEAGILYIVMEFLRGQTLSRLVASEAPLSASRCVAILGQVLDALAEAHAHQVVHRDLKPDNVMVEVLRTGGDFAKVLDFGIAKLRKEERDYETVDGQCGTPEYMPPEQVRGQDDVDGRADLYSVGIVMYEMLTGLTPFGGGSHAEIFAKQLNYAPKPPRKARPDVPISEAMESIVLRLLEKDRDQRFGTAQEVKQALIDALEARQAPILLRMEKSSLPPTGAAVRSQPPRPLERFPLPLVPRPAWSVIEAALAQATYRSIVLGGPDGAGKTSLVRELVARAEEQGYSVLEARVDRSGSRRPGHPLEEVVSTLLGLETDGATNLVELERACTSIGLDHADLFGLAELLTLDGPFAKRDTETRRTECFASFLRLLERASEDAPILLLCEDVDRYDSLSKWVVGRLLTGRGRGKVMVVASGPTATFPGVHRDKMLELEAFTPTEVEGLVGHVLGDGDGALVAAVFHASGGLPMHVEQILRYMAEGGPEPLATLADTIGARIALLPMEARAVLQILSVLGGHASEGLLAGEELGDLESPLTLLSSRGFVRRSHGQVSLAHTLFQDVAYEGIPEEARRRLHGRIFSLLSAEGAPATVLARHAYEARNEMCVQLLETAGKFAKAHLDGPSAAIHFRCALERVRWALLEGSADAERRFFSTSVELAIALLGVPDRMGAEGVLREALGLSTGDASAEATARLHLGRVLLEGGQVERALSELRTGLRTAFRTGDAELMASFYLEFGSLCLLRGDVEAGLIELREGIDWCTGGEGGKAEGGPPSLWHLLLRYGEAWMQGGDRRAAREAAEQALTHAKRVKDEKGEIAAHLFLAEVKDQAGEGTEAMHHRFDALSRLRHLEDRKHMADLLLSMAQCDATNRDRPRWLVEAKQLSSVVGWAEGSRRADELNSSPHTTTSPL